MFTWQDDRAVRDLLARYCVLLDENRSDDLRELFTEDCRVDFLPGSTIVGADAVVAHLAARMVPVVATSHHLSNIVILPEGADSASTIAYLYAWHRYRDGSADGILWGRYLDRVSRVDGAWRISTRKLVVHGMEGFDRPSMHMLDRP